MKHIGLAVVGVAILLSANAAFGQTPCPPGLAGYTCRHPPASRCAWCEVWCSESVYRNPNLSPTTKRKLYEHDRSVCHCDECRRARLAAGIEYMGIGKPRVHVPAPPRVYTPTTPYEPYVCCSGVGIVRKSACPGR